MKHVLSIIMLSTLLISITLQAPTCEETCQNGECESEKCLCHENWLGKNCDRKAKALQEGAFVSQDIPDDGWAFFYYEVDGSTSNLEVLWRTDITGRVRIHVILQGLDSYETPDEKNGWNTTYPAGDTVRTIPFKLNPDSSGGRFVLGIVNTDPTLSPGMAVGVQISFDGIMIGSLTTLSITIAIAILTMFLVSCAMCCLYRKRRVNEIVARQQAEILQLQAMMEQEIERENFLSKEDINKYFPQKKFSELKSSYSQTTCAVCLDEYTPEALCHQLYCEHIFHVPCIEAWLVKHSSCPDCRKPITKKAIQEFLKSAKKVEQENLEDFIRIQFESNPTGNTETITVTNRIEVPRRENHEDHENNDNNNEEQNSLIENALSSVRQAEPENH